jgi:hypothetical protein
MTHNSYYVNQSFCQKKSIPSVPVAGGGVQWNSLTPSPIYLGEVRDFSCADFISDLDLTCDVSVFVEMMNG